MEMAKIKLDEVVRPYNGCFFTKPKSPLRILIEALNVSPEDCIKIKSADSRKANSACSNVRKATGRKFTVLNIGGGYHAIWRIK